MRRLITLDVMRVISLLTIIIYHVFVHFEMQGLPAPFPYFLKSFGVVGVSFFIIISGCALRLSNKNINDGVLSFYKKRLLGILPYFWVAYLVVALFYYFYSGRLDFSNDISPVIWTLTGMDGYLSQTTKTYYLVGEWFTGFILLMYFLYPLVGISLARFPLITICVVSIFAMLTYNYNDYIVSQIWFWNPHPQWNPIARLPEFLFGMLFVQILINNQGKRGLIIIASIIVLICAISHVNLRQGIYSTPLLISCYIIAALIVNTFKITNVIKICIFQLSKYSFMAFLFHHQVIYLSFDILSKNCVTALGFWGYLLLVIVISYVLAFIFYKVGYQMAIWLDKKPASALRMLKGKL